jgi:hypothetical protein
MSSPLRVPGVRICVLRYTDEVTVCANIAGFRALGEWIAWLAASNPDEGYHFHLLWHLESEASRFEGVRPRNVWFLSQSRAPAMPTDAPPDCELREFELTFQVAGEATLDELAGSQDSGAIPPRFQKEEAAVVIQCD